MYFVEMEWIYQKIRINILIFLGIPIKTGLLTGLFYFEFLIDLVTPIK